jgi:hypothetical protein
LTVVFRLNSTPLVELVETTTRWKPKARLGG